MANSNATQLNINLQDSLNLNTNKAEISDFAGFNRRNAPFYNGGLSPLFKQEKTGSVIDKMGNVYKCENGNFYKNDVVIATGIEQQEFVKEKLNVPANPDVYWAIDGENNLLTLTKTGTYTGILKYKNEQITINPLLQKIKCGHINRFIITAGKPVYSLYSGIMYCITYNTNSYTGTLYWCFEGNSPVFNKIEFGSDFGNVVNISDIVVSYIFDEHMNFNGTSGKGWQFRIQYLQEEQIVSSPSPFFIIAPKSNGSYPYQGGYVSVFEYQVPFIIRKEKEELYNTSFKYLTSSKFYTKYNAVVSITGSGSSATGSVTFSPITTSEFELVGTVADNTYTIHDGEMVYSSGITTLSSGNKITISTRNGEPVVYGEGCSAANESGEYNSFSKNFISEGYDKFCVLYNNNVISGISFNGTLLTTFTDVNSEVERTWKDIESTSDYTKLAVIYKSASDGIWYRIYKNRTTDLKLSLIANRYVFINTICFYNAYDTKENAFTHLFYDFNNRVTFDGNKFDEGTDEPVLLSSGINANYEKTLNPDVASIFNPVVLYCASGKNSYSINMNNIYTTPDNQFFFSTFNGDGKRQTVDIYRSKDIATNPVYLFSKYFNGIVGVEKKQDLYDVNYPVSTDGNIILTPSLFATFYDSQIGADYIKDGRYYNLIYYEGLPLLAYYYGSGVANSEARFVIQGQSFVIRNGLIYSTTYNNGLMYINNAIVNVDDLQFIGCLPLAAFFFSPATKCVLAFTGDRNLSTAFEATELKSVLNYKYAPNDNSLYLATEDAVYVLFNTPDGTSFVYKIEEQNVTDFVPQDNGCIALKTGNTWKIFSFYERPDFVRVPLKLTTKFFGAGLNRVSTVDCWYIRAFSEKAEKGKIKVKVQTLTNKSCTSEEQEFLINKEDWDANNGFIYLRYQPKLQRSVGVSLELESDFSIYDIQASINADSTIQITSEKGF